MKAFVFTDKALERHAGRFVWLAIDTEKESNAAVQEKYPDRRLAHLLRRRPEGRARRACAGSAAATVPSCEAPRRWDAPPSAAAPRAASRRRSRAPSALYGDARVRGRGKRVPGGAAPSLRPDWPRYARAVESPALRPDQSARTARRALEVARGALPRLAETPSGAQRRRHRARLRAAAAGRRTPRARRRIALLRDDGARAIADTARDGRRRRPLGRLRRARRGAQGREGRGRRAKTAAEWAASSRGEAAQGEDARARAVFDSHRLSAYIELGEPERAVPMLEASSATSRTTTTRPRVSPSRTRR